MSNPRPFLNDVVASRGSECFFGSSVGSASSSVVVVVEEEEQQKRVDDDDAWRPAAAAFAISLRRCEHRGEVEGGEEHERRNDFGEKSFARARRSEEEEGDIVVVVRAEA